MEVELQFVFAGDGPSLCRSGGELCERLYPELLAA
jgi:hypothetical protein